MSLDYSKIWATNGNTVTITDEEYLEGFAFLLQAPPSKELFNKILQLLDQKILALYSASRGWKAGNSYSLGQVVTSSTVNDYRLMECITAGVSGTAEPVWTGTGTNIADNTVTWKILDTRAGILANRLVALDANAKLPAVDGSQLTNLLSAYPVGSIYMSVLSTSPSTLFGGGTWVQIKDTFLLATGTTFLPGAIGGSRTHTLTVDEIPSHKHIGPFGCQGDLPYGEADGNYTHTGSGDTDHDNRLWYTSSVGGNQAHNNMPPYLAVYVWKRTA